MDLPVQIEVDASTGGWAVDGQPMVLIPRHFWVFVQMAAERRFGISESQEMIFDATCDAARLWCQREAATHGLQGLEVFRHYLKRLGQRGLGQFTVEHVDTAKGLGRVRLEHSVYVAEYGQEAGRSVCYMFGGALVGGLDYACTEAGHTHRLYAEEVQCSAAGHNHCLFEVRSKAGSDDV